MKKEPLHCASIVDMSGVIVEFSPEQMLNIDARDLLIDAESPDETVVFARKCKYIVARNGIVEKKTTLDDGSFAVSQRDFVPLFSSWYNLNRIGKVWYSDNKATSATWVKQKIQAALLPFNISSREITEIYKQLQLHCLTADSIAEPLTIVTASDLNQKVYEKPPFIVDGFLCAGLTILSAPPKTGKSFLALDLACCIAEGVPFWGFKTEKGAVLYCDLEGTEWRTQERLPIVGRNSKTDCPALLSNVYKVAQVDAGLIPQLEAWIASVENPRLIIIDTLAHVKGRVMRGEESYRADTRFLAPLHDLAISKGVAILAITHTRKENSLSPSNDRYDSIIGSTAQFGNADAAWIIGGKRDENKKQFNATGRDFEDVSFEIERLKNGRWRFNGTTEQFNACYQFNEYNSNKVVKFIKEYLPRCGGRWECTAQEFINESASFLGEYLDTDATRMSKKLRELAPQLLKNDGICVNLPNGSGRKGRIFTFEQRSMTN